MILRSPAENYIKYLVIRGLENAEIATRLAWDGLDFISHAYVDTLRDRLTKPDPFRPTDKLHQKTQRFLHREGIHTFFHPNEEMRAARAVLASPRAKEFVETMLLLHAPLSAIALGTTRYRGVACSAGAVEVYRHAFWNIDLLDGAQVRMLLELRYDQLAASDRPEDRSLAAAAKKSQDPRKIAADLPFSPVAAMLVQMRMGMMPAQLRVTDHLEAARNLAVLRTEECLYSPAAKDANRAVQYAMTARIMHELLETAQKPDENLRTELQAIALRMDAPPLPTLQELSRGHHTADLQPIASSEDQDVPDRLDTADPPDAPRRERASD